MPTKDIDCDILVLGGGLGGVAAAVRAARMGYQVCLTEETPWLGGQATAQGVSALEEHQYIETFGGTALYNEFRQAIRTYYCDHYQLTEQAAQTPYLNPGDGWGCRLSFEPKVGLGAILRLVHPLVEAGRLELFYGAQVKAAITKDNRIISVAVEQPEWERQLNFNAAYFLDATELGDLLPLLGIPYIFGAESRQQTGEPDARQDGPAPQTVQSFTYPFVVDYRPGEKHTIPKPPDYEHNRDEQPYSLPLPCSKPGLSSKASEKDPELTGPLGTYRRILAADNFSPGQDLVDLAMINWPGNAFKGGTIIDVPRAQRMALLQQAKNLSLGLLYWLQTEAERDDGQSRGYPELRLRRDVLGTYDGLSLYPYIRESRRILARTTVRQQDVSAQFQPGGRAAHFADSVGLGFYPIDIHGLPGDKAPNGPTKPFQLPLGALIPQHLENFLPAGKNLGMTHITNGCFRPHPQEWNIGEVAGALAAFCLAEKRKPATIFENQGLRRSFQLNLLSMGIPLYWYTDVPLAHPAFSASQILALEGLLPGASQHLRFDPEAIIPGTALEALAKTAEIGMEVLGKTAKSRGEIAKVIANHKYGLAI